jgi:hypothetical protein
MHSINFFSKIFASSNSTSGTKTATEMGPVLKKNKGFLKLLMPQRITKLQKTNEFYFNILLKKLMSIS